MRDIKFKIYDKELKETHTLELQDLCEDDYWYDGDTTIWFVLYDCNTEQKRFVAMQFTGVYDKNGKEIYEGDIFQVDDYTNGVVIYLNEEGCYGLQCKYDEGEWVDPFSDYCLDEMEVLGNKFDNPELLGE